MNERRLAILIASSRFPNEPTLDDLRCPENDVDAINEILTSEVHGPFTEAHVLKNVPHHEVQLKINQVLREASRDDLVLVYYSGHGKLNPAGKLHLATVDTMVSALEATSISLETIRSFADISPSNKLVLMLDCCFSGAAGEAFARSGVDDQLQLTSGGRGTYIMTASTGIQVALEKEADQYGVFTKHVVEGIRSGEADLNGDGQIDVDELYRYVHGRVLEEGFQEPMKWDLSVRGEMVIARTGKTPREDRRRQIRETLLELVSKGVLPDRILSKALEVGSKEPDELSSVLESYDALLDKLLKEDLSVGDFIEQWYQVQASSPSGIHQRVVPDFVAPAEPEPPPKVEPPPPAPGLAPQVVDGRRLPGSVLPGAARPMGGVLKRVKVMIVDDHDVVRVGLRAALELEDDMEVVADAGNAEAALREAELGRPEVVLMDVRMPGTDGIQACRALRERLPETRVVMLTSYSEDEAVFSSIAAGASGYLLKNTPRADLLAAVRSVARGQSLLDPAVTARVLARLTELSTDQEQPQRRRPTAQETPAAEQDPSSAFGSETTLTIMFTDLVDSTAMVDRLGDRRARELLDIHNQIIRRQTNAHGGIEVESMGDGFMLTFPSARLGVGCAVAAQRELDEYNSEHQESRLDVRMGLSVGEPVREEQVLIGKSVVMAARISAKAEGGQVLASQMVHGLLASTGEFTLAEAGDFEMKGISGVHPLYEVLWKRS